MHIEIHVGDGASVPVASEAPPNAATLPGIKIQSTDKLVIIQILNGNEQAVGVPNPGAALGSDYAIVSRDDAGPVNAPADQRRLTEEPRPGSLSYPNSMSLFENKDIYNYNFVRPGTPLYSSQRAFVWANHDRRIIEVDGGMQYPIVLEVRQYHPTPGEAVDQTWFDHLGNGHIVKIAPYALVDEVRTYHWLKNYVARDYCYFAEAVDDPDDLVRLIHHEAVDFHRTQPGPYLLTCLRFCYGNRLTMGLLNVCGSDKLGSSPILHTDHPLFGEIAPPGKAGDQFEKIMLEILMGFQWDFLFNMHEMLRSELKAAFFPNFLVVFIVLHEVECISNDRFQYARQNREDHRFSLPEFVEDLHHSAHCMIVRWLKFTELHQVDWSSEDRLNQTLLFLTDTQRAIIVQSYLRFGQVTTLREESPEPDAMPPQFFHFIPQMFPAKWDGNDRYIMQTDTWGPEDHQNWVDAQD